VKWAETNENTKQMIAKKVASNLREFGYPNITPGYVLKQLASEDRDVIGMMAADMLAENGFTDMED
jgi:hypothetical protein